MTYSKQRKNGSTDREGQINFRYDKDKKKRLYAMAEEEGISVSQLLAGWCDEYIGEKPKSRLDSEARLAKLEEMMQIALEKLEGKSAA
ncbi:MAG: hypothetical protein SAK29_15205 [Scytonema sp. PMC 1069.18]|nr:hypothetical protein [Scytonema sp. PMC 1069.18]MEC4883743.1 hypothetical protein [Scytonema sp. PMC 1070.18]